ncbi:hypothetical protein PV327_006174 [Microctonus hyperodae]|uniref:Uncharacterized protein n=1 Tax=Microctonus hyperodae TaxID=165561 RepID=A0AA39F3T1_MICHY|nr:hypothetical protein PV327_006174 [Microctonus hyperodae]
MDNDIKNLNSMGEETPQGALEPITSHVEAASASDLATQVGHLSTIVSADTILGRGGSDSSGPPNFKDGAVPRAWGGRTAQSGAPRVDGRYSEENGGPSLRGEPMGAGSPLGYMRRQANQGVAQENCALSEAVRECCIDCPGEEQYTQVKEDDDCLPRHQRRSQCRLEKAGGVQCWAENRNVEGLGGQTSWSRFQEVQPKTQKEKPPSDGPPAEERARKTTGRKGPSPRRSPKATGAGTGRSELRTMGSNVAVSPRLLPKKQGLGAVAPAPQVSVLIRSPRL